MGKHKAKSLTNKSLIKINNGEAKFCFSLYPYSPWGVATPKTFGDSDEEIQLSPLTKCSSRVLSLLAIIAPTLLPTKVELGKCNEVTSSKNAQVVRVRSRNIKGSSWGLIFKCFGSKRVICGAWDVGDPTQSAKIIYPSLHWEGIMSLGGLFKR